MRTSLLGTIPRVVLTTRLSSLPNLTPKFGNGSLKLRKEKHSLSK